MSLSAMEKEELMEIIEIALGRDSSIDNVKANFNESTVDVVEEMLNALAACNDSMKQLVSSLIGGGRYLVKGWLKKALGIVHREHKNEKLKFNGLACRNTAHMKWRQAIIISAY